MNLGSSRTSAAATAKAAAASSAAASARPIGDCAQAITSIAFMLSLIRPENCKVKALRHTNDQLHRVRQAQCHLRTFLLGLPVLAGVPNVAASAAEASGPRPPTASASPTASRAAPAAARARGARRGSSGTAAVPRPPTSAAIADSALDRTALCRRSLLSVSIKGRSRNQYKHASDELLSYGQDPTIQADALLCPCDREGQKHGPESRMWKPTNCSIQEQHL